MAAVGGDRSYADWRWMVVATAQRAVAAWLDAVKWYVEEKCACSLWVECRSLRGGACLHWGGKRQVKNRCYGCADGRKFDAS